MTIFHTNIYFSISINSRQAVSNHDKDINVGGAIFMSNQKIAPLKMVIESYMVSWKVSVPLAKDDALNLASDGYTSALEVSVPIFFMVFA